MSQISCWLSRRSLTNAIRPGIGTGAGAAALSRHPPRVPHTIAIEHVVGNRAFTLRLLWRVLIKLRAEGATFHLGALAPDDAVRHIDKSHLASLPREEVHGAPESKHPVRGVAPSGFFGAGAVLLNEKGSTGADKTQGFAHLGVGIAYTIKSGLSIFAQGDGLFYSLTEMTSPTFTSFNAAQIDVGWSAGVSYRLGL